MSRVNGSDGNNNNYDLYKLYMESLKRKPQINEIKIDAPQPETKELGDDLLDFDYKKTFGLSITNPQPGSIEDLTSLQGIKVKDVNFEETTKFVNELPIDDATKLYTGLEAYNLSLGGNYPRLDQGTKQGVENYFNQLMSIS